MVVGNQQHLTFVTFTSLGDFCCIMTASPFGPNAIFNKLTISSKNGNTVDLRHINPDCSTLPYTTKKHIWCYYTTKTHVCGLTKNFNANGVYLQT